MRDVLNSSVFGSIEHEAQKKIRKEINERWDKLGLCEGLNGHMKETVATLYENQARHLIYETQTADNSGSFETVVFPMIRRVFSKLLTNDIVSVQAMTMPVGRLFFFRPTTSQRQFSSEDLEDGVTGRHNGLMGYSRTQRTDGKTTDRYYLPDAALPSDVVTPAEPGKYLTKYEEKSLYDLFYDDFLFDNSKGKVTLRVMKSETATGSENVKFVVFDANRKLKEESLANYPVSGIDGSLSNVMIKLSGFHEFNKGRLTGPDGNEMDSEAFLASLKFLADGAIDGGTQFTSFDDKEEIPFRVVTQRYGTGIASYESLCDKGGNIIVELDLTKPAVEAGSTINGYIGVDPAKKGELKVYAIWNQYDSLELETEMGEVGFQLDSVTVTTEERKLRATWSPELAQDVSAFHNIDAEAELTALLSEQIAAETDREVLRDLRKAAPWRERWDYNGWQRIGTTSTVYTQKDWNQTLMTKVNQISAQIQKSTLKGGANWIVVSSEISAVLNDLEYFHVTDASAESDQYNMGIEKVGSILGRYRVIVDPWAPHHSLIMGHHGTSLLDTGYIYAPYVPMVLTPTTINPFNFAPVKGICTRYAKKLVNNRYFGAIQVDGLTYWDASELR